jgi:hypothetical protein
MGQLVFQATLGGQVNLVGPNTASTFNLSVPAVTATLATTDANTFTASQTFSAGTANGVAYLNGSKVLTTGSALVFDGTNLGIGTTSPTTKLDVRGSGVISLKAESSNNSAQITLNSVSGGVSYINYAQNGANSLAFYDSTAIAERARIDSSGRLLVGTTSSIGTTSVGKLQVLGGETFITTNSEVGGFVGVNSNADNSVAIAADPDSLRSGSHIAFYVDGFSEKARIDSSGNLLVGTTSTGNSNSKSFVANVASGFIVVNHLNGQGSGSGYASFGYNASEIGSITQNGTTAVLYNTTSDQRLKENIVDADSASTLIDALQVRQFDWKTDNTHQRYGFIAQELVTVAPEAVHQPADPKAMMAVDYSKLVPMLVKEIQSLRQRLTAAGI